MIPDPLVEVVRSRLCYIRDDSDIHCVGRTPGDIPSDTDRDQEHEESITEGLHDRTKSSLVGRPREIPGQSHQSQLIRNGGVRVSGYLFGRFLQNQDDQSTPFPNADMDRSGNGDDRSETGGVATLPQKPT